MQIVYISNRPDVLNETLVHVGWFMPFVTEAVVLCPRSVFPSLIEPAEGPAIRPVADQEILSETDSGPRRAMTRTRRNYTLRARLVTSRLIRPEFIMSDDDYRPLKTVSEDIFIHNDRYKSYYFYDLDQWHSAETDFDSVQHNVAGALDYLGMPRLAFASHMPQIVKRDWYLESVEEFEKLGGDLDICEWSAYFNYSIKTHPDSFTEPEPYLTMCWPDHPDSWPMYVTPKEHWFENFYPESYVPSGPFHGMRTICEDKQSQERANLEKLNRWRLYIAKSRNARTDLRRFPERQLRKALRSTLIDLKSQVFYSRRKT